MQPDIVFGEAAFLAAGGKYPELGGRALRSRMEVEKDAQYSKGYPAGHSASSLARRGSLADDLHGWTVQRLEALSKAGVATPEQVIKIAELITDACRGMAAVRLLKRWEEYDAPEGRRVRLRESAADVIANLGRIRCEREGNA